MSLHVCISDSGSDLELLSSAISGKGTANWYVTKTAELGDRVAIYVGGIALIFVRFLAIYLVKTPQ